MTKTHGGVAGGAGEPGGPDVGRPDVADATLRSVPLFRDLEPAGFERLRAATVVRRFAAGEVLVKAGSAWDALLVLCSGSVKVHHQRLGYCDQVIDDVGPGKPLALMPVLDQHPIPCSITGTAPGEYLFIPGETFRGLLDDHPRLALKMLRCVTGRFRTMAQLAGALSQLSLEERLVLFILRNAPVAGAADAKVWDRNHEEVGQRVGGSREEITRVLSRLKKRGLIRTGWRKVEILDEAGLRRLAPELPHTPLA